MQDSKLIYLWPDSQHDSPPILFSVRGGLDPVEVEEPPLVTYNQTEERYAPHIKAFWWALSVVCGLASWWLAWTVFGYFLGGN